MSHKSSKAFPQKLKRLKRTKGYIYQILNDKTLFLTILDKNPSGMFHILPKKPKWKCTKDKEYYEAQLQGFGYCTNKKVICSLITFFSIIKMMIITFIFHRKHTNVIHQKG